MTQPKTAEEVARELGEQLELGFRAVDIIEKALLSFSLKQMEPMVEALEFYYSGFYESGYDGLIHPIGALKSDKGEVAKQALAHYEHLKTLTERSEKEK